jgi:hypothetical protein
LEKEFHFMHATRSTLSLTILAAILSACTSAPVDQEPKETQTNVAPSESSADPVATKGLGVAQSKSAEGSGKKSKENRKPAHHRWAMYRWARTTSPATLPIANCLTTREWTGHFKKATKDWNTPRNFGADFMPLPNRAIRCRVKQECVEMPGTTTVCNGEYGENGWLGMATISVDGDFITQGLSQMNDTYFKTARYNNPNEKRHVMCHEVAHTFGLGHQSEDGSSQNSCMDYFPNIDENADSTLSTRPSFHDFEELSEIYAETESFTTLSSPTRKKSKLAKASRDPKTWGKLKSQSSDGRGSVYEKRNSDGTKLLTHVYWTKEVADQCSNCDHRDHSHE